MPSVIYVSEGIETNIYFDNVIFSNLPNDLLAIDITCLKGRQYDKFWRIIPQATDTGTTEIKIEVSIAGKILATKTSMLIITGKNKGSGSSIKVLCIGDSTTAGAIHQHYQYRLPINGQSGDDISRKPWEYAQ